MKLAPLILMLALAGCGGEKAPKAAPANTNVEPPAAQPAKTPPGFILDNAHLLSPEQKTTLDARLRTSAAQTGQQLVIATLPSLNGMPMDRVVNDLGNRLGLHDGVILVVAVKERQVRLAVGQGALKLISDAEAQHIVTVDMRPDLHANRFDQGILKGADKILSQLSETRA